MNARSEASKSRLERLLTLVLSLQWWLLLCVGVAGGVLYYQQPLEEPVELRALVAEAQAQKDALTAERKRVSDRIEWLKTEPAYLEAKVREKLNQQKDGETILHFQ